MFFSVSFFINKQVIVIVHAEESCYYKIMHFSKWKTRQNNYKTWNLKEIVRKIKGKEETCAPHCHILNLL